MKYINKIRNSVLNFIQAENLTSPGDRILLSVSGGQDSVCMLDIIYNLRKKLNIDIAIGHINHQLRGEESERDEEFVRTLSKRYDIPVHIETIDVASYAKKNRKNIEEAGRIIRYQYLKKIAQANKLNKVATAHTAQDRIEWLFLALMRGSGAGGLSGMRPKTDFNGITVIKPLLSLFRDDTYHYLKEAGLEFRVDKSNYDLSIDRNYIREMIIPLLKKRFSPTVFENILRSIELIGEDDDYLNARADTFLSTNSEKSPFGFIFRVEHLSDLKKTILTRVIRLACKRLGTIYPPSMDNVLRAVSLFKENISGKSSPLTEDVFCEVSENMARIGREIDTIEFQYTVDSIPALVDIPELNKVIQFETLEKFELDKRDFQFLINTSNINLPLRLRNVRAGDRMNPMGMEGSKKISDILIDMKIPLWDRKRVVIIEDKAGIVGLFPYRLSERARLRIGEKGILVREVK